MNFVPLRLNENILLLLSRSILYKMQSHIFVNFVSAVYTLVPNIKMCLTRSNFSLTIVIADVEKQACDSVGELSV